jgi:hypothetical protein
MMRGTLGNMALGTTLDHEGIGIIEEVGRNVRNLHSGNRTLISSAISCGDCSYRRSGYTAQCGSAHMTAMRWSRSASRRANSSTGSPSRCASSSICASSMPVHAATGESRSRRLRHALSRVACSRNLRSRGSSPASIRDVSRSGSLLCCRRRNDGYDLVFFHRRLKCLVILDLTPCLDDV